MRALSILYMPAGAGKIQNLHRESDIYIFYSSMPRFLQYTILCFLWHPNSDSTSNKRFAYEANFSIIPIIKIRFLILRFVILILSNWYKDFFSYLKISSRDFFERSMMWETSFTRSPVFVKVPFNQRFVFHEIRRRKNVVSRETSREHSLMSFEPAKGGLRQDENSKGLTRRWRFPEFHLWSKERLGQHFVKRPVREKIILMTARMK